MNSSPLRVNLGCGHLPLEGYVNVDKYADEADIKKDALKVHFEQVHELVAYHLLEHMSPFDAAYLLVRALAWMRSGGTLEVEVPDMQEIMELGPSNHSWPVYIYGSQEHEGEIHRWGYTLESLTLTVEGAGWVVDEGRRFYSRHDQRKNMPCITVKAHRP